MGSLADYLVGDYKAVIMLTVFYSHTVIGSVLLSLQFFLAVFLKRRLQLPKRLSKTIVLFNFRGACDTYSITAQLYVLTLFNTVKEALCSFNIIEVTLQTPFTNTILQISLLLNELLAEENKVHRQGILHFKAKLYTKMTSVH